MTAQPGLKLLSLCFTTEPRDKQCKEYTKTKAAWSGKGKGRWNDGGLVLSGKGSGALVKGQQRAFGQNKTKQNPKV